MANITNIISQFTKFNIQQCLLSPKLTIAMNITPTHNNMALYTLSDLISWWNKYIYHNRLSNNFPSLDVNRNNIKFGTLIKLDSFMLFLFQQDFLKVYGYPLQSDIIDADEFYDLLKINLSCV